MNNKIDIVIYPQGFAGFDIGLPSRTIKASPAEMFNSMLFRNNGGRSNKVVVSNTTVEKLWNDLISANNFGNNFNFREQILVTALNAFGTSNFLDWIRLQSQNPYLNTNHYRFINDTLNFIRGENRALNIQYWLTLLSENSAVGNESSKVKINEEKFFNTNKPLHMRESTQLKSSIVQWVSKPGGFEDLLGTLHVLFGDSETQ